MHAFALSSAKPGRLRPSFFLLLGACGLAQAQQPVYRCGHEYTNAPQEPSRCEALAPQAVTVIPGTRVQGQPAAPAPVAASSAASVPAPAAQAMPPGAVAGPAQKQRDEMARQVLVAELELARQRHLKLQEEYQQAASAQPPSQTQGPQSHTQPLALLKAAVERSQRDIESLQREMLRRPQASSPP